MAPDKLPVRRAAAGRAQAFKRDVYIRDDSGTSVNVTLWGAYCTAPGDQLEEVRPQMKYKKASAAAQVSSWPASEACAPDEGSREHDLRGLITSSLVTDLFIYIGWQQDLAVLRPLSR